MEEKKIEFKTAKLADNKGFVTSDKSCGLFTEDKKYHPYMAHWLHEYKEFYFAPTQSLLQKWLREVHGIHINIGSFHCLGKEKPFSLSIDYKEDSIWTYAEFDETDFNTYEEALERGLQEGLELIKIEEYGSGRR